MKQEQLLRYSRHILLPKIDLVGQQKIMDSRILVMGCGGLGCTVIPFLAASGVGSLTIIDDDVVDMSNLQRQTHYTNENIGQLKAEAMADYIARQNSEISVMPISLRLDQKALTTLCESHDVIVDCSDNFKTRHMVNKASVATKVPMVFGSALRFEGQLTVFDPRDSKSPCYACLFDQSENEQDNCSFSGVFSPLVGIIGARQAAEAIKLIVGIGESAVGTLFHYDVLSLKEYPLKVTPNPHCQICNARLKENS
ncbi:MAG: HesA/MoeB/ThiF family protein [Commensalibacter sp.]|nr:HesA/MoeB/ThiF family protein [Commensalibacter sp.]